MSSNGNAAKRHRAAGESVPHVTIVADLAEESKGEPLFRTVGRTKSTLTLTGVSDVDICRMSKRQLRTAGAIGQDLAKFVHKLRRDRSAHARRRI